MKINNLQELGRAFGINPTKRKPEKQRKCNKCGGKLHRVAGTNVYICDGINPENKQPYKHRVLSGKPALVEEQAIIVSYNNALARGESALKCWSAAEKSRQINP